jgi:hypothetical protein
MKKILWMLSLAAVLAALWSCASGKPAQTGTPPVKIDISTARARAQAAMDKAKTAKADIAVKEMFNTAMDTWNTAESRASSSPDQALDMYLNAEKQFLAAHDEANVKKAEAQRLLDLARSAIKGVEDDAEAYAQEQREAGGAQ